MKVTCHGHILSFMTVVILSVSNRMTDSLPISDINVSEPKNSAECRNRRGYQFYYDHGTEHCEQCREICLHAKLMRTTEQCQAECPQYLHAMQCEGKEDEYYDEAVDMCTPCSELCDNHQITGNSRECKKKCGAYLEKLTPKQVPSMHKQNYLKAIDGSDAESNKSSLTLHPGWIAAIAVGVLSCICIIAVVIVLRLACHQQYTQAPQEAPQEEQKTSQRPVEESSQGSKESQHFAIDTGTGSPQTAFSDLMNDTSRNIESV